MTRRTEERGKVTLSLFGVAKSQCSAAAQIAFQRCHDDKVCASLNTTGFRDQYIKSHSKWSAVPSDSDPTVISQIWCTFLPDTNSSQRTHLQEIVLHTVRSC